MTAAVEVERLKEVIEYDSATGQFTWRQDLGAGRPKAGDAAGLAHTSALGCKHIRIKIDGRRYYAHRLAWLYVHGAWPADRIDHIDGNGLNNRLANLREATHAENLRNRGKQKNNSSGFKGVYWDRRGGKWRAQIMLNNRMKSLGSFETKEAAHDSYCAACAAFHGKFGRVA